MTPRAYLDAVRKRCEAATAGPWDVPSANVHRVIAFNGDDATRLIVEHPEEIAFFGADSISYWDLGCEDGGRQSAADRDFIAHARTDLPKLERIARLAEDLLEAEAYDYTSSDLVPKAKAALFAALKELK